MPKACAQKTVRQQGRREPKAEASLVFSAETFGDEAVRALVDEWIVPALVEEFFRCRTEAPSSPETEHNECL